MKNLAFNLCLIVFTVVSNVMEITDNENHEIKKVIIQLFDAMRTSNKVKAEAVFRPEALLQTVYVTKEGITVVKEESLKEFIEALGATRQEVWDERVQSFEINTDGLIATVWTPYKFYVNDTFSHCGNNAFILVKTQHGWKISSIIDTRRKNNCN
ncbi:MAG: nuclear transport factor 2 family protein [Bacteroidia bacterium]